MSATVNVLGFQSQNWIQFVRENSELVGFWLKHIPQNVDLTLFLEATIVSDKTSGAKEKNEASYISISLGDYRVVTNIFDGRGGYYVMIGSAKAPGETVPPLTSVRWTKGSANPKSMRVNKTCGVKGVKFGCPTCGLPNYCFDDSMADDAGAMVECGHCGNIAHVPGEFKKVKETSELEIRGCAYVPISEFSDWFFAHPTYATSNTEDLGSYGLWVYCADCKHQYSSTVLPIFVLASIADELLFNARSQASANDMKGLREGKCQNCGHGDLLALMIEIPMAIREKIAFERHRQTGGS